MTTTETTAHHRITKPECFVVQDKNGSYLALGYDWDYGKPLATRNPDEAREFDSKAEADAAIVFNNLNPRTTRSLRRRAKVEMTDEGRAAVMARRAARRAERAL